MAKFGRTSPCFCGSNKKFKKCCEKLTKKEPKTLINLGSGGLQINDCIVHLQTIYDPRLSDAIVKATVKQVIDFYEKTYPNGDCIGKLGTDFIEHPRLTVGCLVNTLHPHHYSIWLGPEDAINDILNAIDDYSNIPV